MQRILDLRSTLKLMVDDGLLAQKQADGVIAMKRNKAELLMHPLNFIAGLSLINEQTGKTLDNDTVVQWMAEFAELPMADIDPLKIDARSTTAVMSLPFAKKHNILCIDVNEEEMTIACSQPFTSGWEDQLVQVNRRQIKRVFADPSDLKRYTDEFYTVSSSVAGAKKKSANTTTHNFEQLLELGATGNGESNDQHVVKIVDWLLQYAFDQRASDIHIEPRREQGRVRFRIDGILHEVYEFPVAICAAVTSRLKVLGRMNVAEKRKPQDGRVKTKRPDGKEVELRLSTLPTAFGEKMVLRIFNPDVLLRSFEQLGLAGKDLKRWGDLLALPHGIVLLTGPTGSGKTTTLYSSLKRLATGEVNVSTVEDPIEMVEEAFNQTQVQHNIDFDFAAGLRTLMRQDPDIIMVGEIRDTETAQMAAQAALTGHLVLSTLHTNDAPAGISRLLDLGLPPYLIRTAVAGIVAQRLVRTLCKHCKKPKPIDPIEWQDLVAPWKALPPKQVFEPVGCKECRDTGYHGRRGLYEIMPVSREIKALITDSTDMNSVKQQAFKEGCFPLRLAGAQAVANGQTSIAEVLRVVPF